MERKGRTEIKGWMDDLDNAMLQALADGNHGELRRIIDELEQTIAAARSNLEEIERSGGKSAGGKGAKGDVIYGRFGSSDDEDEGGSEATESDVDEFLADAVEAEDGASVTVDELEAAFEEWARGRGLGAVDHTVFMRGIDRAGYRSGRIAGANRVIGVRRKSADGKSWPGSPEIVGAFARDPVEADEAERMWDEFVRWASAYEGDDLDFYVEASRDDFDLLVPMGRGHIERGLAVYRQYIEDNYERRKSARRPAGKARPTSAHKLYA